MTTGSSSHTHKVTVAGRTYTTATSAHAHAESPDPDAARITALEARVKAIEDAAAPPVITPVPGPGGVVPAPASASRLACTPGTDQSAAFAALFAAGRSISLDPGATYLMDRRTQVQMDGWVLFGQGAKVHSRGIEPAGSWDAWLRPILCRDITILDVGVIGPGAPDVAVTEWLSQGKKWTRENSTGIKVEGGSNVRLERVSAHQFYGDGVYVGARDQSGGLSTPDGVHLVDLDLGQVGRNSISLTAGRNVDVVRGQFHDAGLCAWDTEPNRLEDATANVSIRGASFARGNQGKTDSASHDSHGNGYLIMLSAGEGPFTGYVLDGCDLDVGAIYAVPKVGRNSGLVLTNNVAHAAGDATIARTDGLVFTNNPGIAKVVVAA